MSETHASDSVTLYTGVILEHFRRPRNQRRLESPSATHEAHNPLCGDRIRIEVLVGGGIVQSAAFTANACAVCTAAASLLTERIQGGAVEGAKSVTDADVLAALETSLPQARLA